MRSITAALSTAAFICVATPVPALPADACSCAVTSLEERVERAEVVFTGREIGRTRIDDGPDPRVEVTFAVETAYRGDIAEEYTVSTGFGGGDCGVGSLTGHGMVGVLVHSRENPSIGICGSIANAVEVAVLFDGLPQPSGTGESAFVVAHRLGESRIAILDEFGEVLRHGTGVGVVDAITVCPGNRSAVAMVLIEDEATATTRAEIHALDLGTLEVRDVRVLPRPPSQRHGTNLMRWIESLHCHDPHGEAVSYLLPRWAYDAGAGADLYSGGAVVHVWDGLELIELSAGSARSVAVDWDTGRVFAVTGRDGRGFAVWDIPTGEPLIDVNLPETFVGWKIALSRDGTTVAVLARHEPMDRDNWYFAEVNAVLLVSTEGASVGAALLEAPTYAIGIERWGDGFAAVTATWESGSVVDYVGPGGELVRHSRISSPGWPRSYAIGSDVGLFSGLDEGSRGVIAVDNATLDSSAVEGLLNATAMAALEFGRSAPAAQPVAPRVSPATTPAPSLEHHEPGVVVVAEADPPLPTTTNSGDSERPLPSRSPPPATTTLLAEVFSRGTGEGAGLWLAAAMAVALAAGVGIGFGRRRHRR